MEAREQPDGALAGLVILLPERAERGAGGIVGRERRADALHAAAFLVDEDRRVGAADAVAHLGDEIADLLGLADVAGKQDEAPGAFAAVESDFLAAERLSVTAEDHGF